MNKSAFPRPVSHLSKADLRTQTGARPLSLTILDCIRIILRNDPDIMACVYVKSNELVPFLIPLISRCPLAPLYCIQVSRL